LQLVKQRSATPPLSINIADSRSLVEMVETSDVLNAVDFPFADTQATKMIQAMLEDGSIGEVTSVDLRPHFSKRPRDWQGAAS